MRLRNTIIVFVLSLAFSTQAQINVWRNGIVEYEQVIERIDSITFANNKDLKYPKMFTERVVDGMPVFDFGDKGMAMPRLGLGTQRLTGSDEDKVAACKYAISKGFRHFDSAHAYGTEGIVGQAIRECGVPREEIWVTTKLWPSDYRNERIETAIDRRLNALGLDYIDLLYIHHPYGEFMEAWPYLEQAVKDGKVRFLGISNFELKPELIDELFEKAEIKPVIMQVECNPYARRPEVEALIKSFGMAQECWYPLGGPNSRQQGFTSPDMRLNDPVLKAIGEAHGKSAVQVILRWHLQNGRSAVPGTEGRPDIYWHFDDNIDITDFSLSEDEMRQINELNKTDFRFFPATYESMQRIANMDLGNN